MRPRCNLRHLVAASLVLLCLGWSRGNAQVANAAPGASDANTAAETRGVSATAPKPMGANAAAASQGVNGTATAQGGDAAAASQGADGTAASQGGNAAAASPPSGTAKPTTQFSVSTNSSQQPKIDLSSSVPAIQKAIKNSKSLSGYSSWSVRAKDNVLEVSTYQQKGSTAKDCKIDAVLLSEEIMTKFPQVLQMSMSFYPFSGSGKYQQVSVTIGEITAFSKGLIDQQKLLASLTVKEKIDEQQRTPSVKTATAQQPRTLAGWLTYNAPGIAFEYPSQWQLSRGDSEDTVVQLRSANQVARSGKILLKLYFDGNKITVAEAASAHIKNHRSYRNYQQLKPPEVIRFGASNQLTGMAENFAWSGPDGVPFYERHIYFGWPGSVYKLSMESSRNDYIQVSSLFDHLLGTFRTSAAKGL